MKKPLPEWVKPAVGAAIIALIILVIIVIRNRKKASEAAASEALLRQNGGVKQTTSNIGKTAYVNSNPTKFFSTDGNLNLVYQKTSIGEFAGSILADQTDSGSTGFYKILNTSGNKLYVLKSSVTVQ